MNPEPGGLTLRFEVDGDDFTSAGQASVQVKKSLRQLGISPDIIRKVSIAMYRGPGIADIDLAMQEGYSTAPDAVRSLGFGAGMGLPNMKRYTDDMTIESQLGKGTTITMRVNL